jgi:hypothetical protein
MITKTYIHKGKKHKGRIPRKLKRKHKRNKIALILGISAAVISIGAWVYNRFIKEKIKVNEKEATVQQQCSDTDDVTPDAKEINITVEGNIEELSVDCCNKISVTGDVGSVKTQSGDVDVTGNVNGSIQSMSGSVDCGNVSGSISTMSGSVKHKKV